MSNINFYISENLENKEVKISKSGKYSLIISYYKTIKGSWDYSKGEVINNFTNESIAEIFRNYHSFPFLFIEDHKNGHDYLICGADYQGQTVIELDSGNRRDVSKNDKGYGFCWAGYNFNSKLNILVVDGCYWAAPYEFKLFDFSDPINGWEEIEYADENQCGGIDEKTPAFNEDETITFFQSKEEFDEENEDDNNLLHEILSTKTFKIVNNKLEFISEFISDEEKENRRIRKENDEAYKKWKAEFLLTDPLYLSYCQLVKDPILSPSPYDSWGITYNNWCPHFSGKETRYCRRIVSRSKDSIYIIDLEWGVKTAPIKITIFKNDKFDHDKWFEHSADGMKKAFDYVKKIFLYKL